MENPNEINARTDNLNLIWTAMMGKTDRVKRPLRVLIVEDSEEDALLMVRELERGGYDPTFERVETAEKMKEALCTKTWDLVLADYSLPHFSGLEALEVLKASGLDLPFIIVSGAIGEDVAVQAMKAGAHDYLMKDKLKRLVPAIEQELREAGVRRKLKESEKVLQESEKRYRQVVENATEIIYTVDERGNFTYANPAGLKVTGYSLGELRRLNYADLLLPDHRERVSKTYINQLRERLPATYVEFPFFNKTGKITWFGQNATLVTEGDKIVGFHIIARDITGRKIAEQALFDSEQRYRNLVEHAPDVIYTLASDGTITSLNPAFEKITGWPRAEWLHRPFSPILHPDDLPRGLEFFDRILKGERPTPFQLRVLTKSGECVVAEFMATRQAGNGSDVGILGIARDITERKQAEQEMAALQEQLRQAQKMEAIGRLAGGVAHDFNNQLTVINGYSQLSLIGMNTGNPLRENIEEIKRAADRAADLTRQLLAFSRRQILEMKVLDLNDLFRNLDKMLRRIIGEDIDLVTLLAQDLGPVNADPGQIEQVIMNLAVNARDAMPNGGKLTIETANVELDEEYGRAHVAVRPGRYVMLSVSDTGVGMSPEVRDRVFEPFFTTKEKGKGTGLGLSTVYGIVKQSGGNIWVYSEIGKGATFKIYLPRVDEPLEELEEKQMGTDLPRGNETILVVEDEKEVLKLAGRILKRQGYAVLEVSSGEEALRICREKKTFHLLLTDVVLPKRSGRQLVEDLREICQSFKVLYMSGYADQAVIRHGILEKGMDYLQKPFTVERLVRKIREVLDR
jgi:two-component system cell cycle sensor histidine kinase/response regulator CckA